MQGSGYTDFLHGIHFHACSWLKQKIPDVNTALEITASTIIFHNFYYCRPSLSLSKLYCLDTISLQGWWPNSTIPPRQIFYWGEKTSETTQIWLCKFVRLFAILQKAS